MVFPSGDSPPPLERANGLSGGSLCDLSDTLAGSVPEVSVLSGTALTGWSDEVERTPGRTLLGPVAKRPRRGMQRSLHHPYRRRNAERTPLRRGGRAQKRAPNVSPILHQHRKAALCVC